MKKNYICNLVWLMVLIPLWGFTQNISPLSEDSDWTIEAIYPVNDYASGLAWDGDYIYIGGYGGNQGAHIYRFDPSDGSHELFFTGPQDQAFGLTFDGEYLWTIDRESPSSTPAYALKLDMDGNAVDQFDLPDHYMSGIAFDDGNFWVATYFPNPGTIYHLDASDDPWDTIAYFEPPQNQPWDLARQDQYLWIAEYNESNLHQVELDGTMVETYPGSNYRTSGVVYDGNFLWYVSRESNGDSFLYKVNLTGEGTPQISVPGSFDFAHVTIHDTKTWEMPIENTGEGDLVINDIMIAESEPFYAEEIFPLTIEPGQSHVVEIQFAPLEIGFYESTLLLETNDPSNPQVDINLNGVGLAPEPYLYTNQENIDYGGVRFKSSSREYLYLQNMGNGLLEISGIHLSDESFYLGYDVEFPITLEPVESIELPLWFHPLVTLLIEAEATVMYNHDNSPLVIDLSGTSQDMDYPVGDVLWEHQFTGSFDYHAKAIMSMPDINHNGYQDILVGTRDNTIRAFNGNASDDADLLWEIQLGTVEYPKAMALASDINGDGLSDIVVGTAWGDRAVTALSSQTGEVLWRFETNLYGQGGWVYMVDVKYDYNGNGYLDVLAATGDDVDGTGPKRVFCLDGKNGEIIWETSINAAAYSVVAVEDFTGDGSPDVVAGASSPTDQGRVIGINGATGAIEWEYITPGTSVWAVEQISDITGNGISDLIAGSFNGEYFLMDITDGSVEHSGTLGNVLILDFWKAGDINGDGYEDIIPAYSTISNAVAISGQNGEILWSTSISDQPWSISVLRDITGDGINDVAVGTLFQNNNVYFLDGSDGEIIDIVPFASAVDAIGNIPDITGDNSVEVIAGGRDGYLAVLSGGLGVDAPKYTINFEVKDTLGNPLKETLMHITQTGHRMYTDTAGQAAIALYQGNYDFLAKKQGFITGTGTFEVQNEELFIEVTLIEGVEEFMVTFDVTDDQQPPQPLEEVAITVSMKEVTLFTDENGLAEIQLEPGIYDFTAKKDHFFPYDNSFEVVDENLQISFAMQSDDTYVQSLNHPYLSRAYCYPNPFTDYTQIIFSLVKDTEVSFTFYDSNGRVVKRTQNQRFPAGEHEYYWNGSRKDGSLLGQGLYFFEIKTGDKVFRDRVIILRK